MRTIFFPTSFILLACTATAPTAGDDFTGKYSDGFGVYSVTELVLNSDSTFQLKTVDPVFPYTYRAYTNTGNWTARKNQIILNPQKAPRKPEIKLTQSTIESDSVTIKIIYRVRTFAGDEFESEENFEFDQLTVFVNKRRDYINLVRHQKRRICLFTPRVKNQIVVDSTNAVKVLRARIGKLGVMTYCLGKTIWLNVADAQANVFEIEIIQPVDAERTPRSKRVIIKGRKAYFYEKRGRTDTSWFATPLQKVGT